MLLAIICFLISANLQHVICVTSSVSNPVCVAYNIYAKAKDWNENKGKVALLTLLRGKLVNIYMTLDKETHKDLQCLKKALMAQAGPLRDPLPAAQSFSYVLLPKTW